jgi:glycosyltransferase involved in cell wall biosynthesis
VTLPLSALWVVRDAAEELPLSIGSVAGWAGELVVVVDDRTRDGTEELAAASGAEVSVHPFSGLGALRNLGLSRCRHDWVLVLDADECATPELEVGVAAALSGGERAAYALRRVNLVLGKRVRFGDWGRDAVVRLLDRRRARFSGHPVHPVVEAASVGRVRVGFLEHDTLRSVAQYLPKLHDYALRGGAELAARGTSVRWWQPIARAEWRFVRAYFLRGGFLDGARGLLVAVLAAHGTFLKWSAAWDQRRRGR